jgi:hypothetical protein
VTLLLSVAIMNIYRWRTDVLIGPYISRDSQPAVADTGGDAGSRGNTMSSATSNGWRPIRLKRTSRHAPTSQKGSRQFYARSRISLIQETFLAGLSGKIWRWLPIKALAHQRRSRAPHERRSNAVKQTPGEPFDHTKPGAPATSRTPSHAALILPAPWLCHPEPFLPEAAFPPTHSANPADPTRFPAMDRQELPPRFR